MDLELSGKRALVTGSSSGIGAAIAEFLAGEGIAVVIHGRDTARIERVAARIAAIGGHVAAAPGDLATDNGAAQVGEAALAAFGGIDILVNNAGGIAQHDPNWFATQPDAWAETYQRNVLAGVRLIHLLTPGMNTGVTSNAVSPGLIRTEGLDDFLASVATQHGWGSDHARAEQHVIKAIGQTVARIGNVGDIAFAIAMLASPRSDFLNGTNLHVDGGISPSLH